MTSEYLKSKSTLGLIFSAEHKSSNVSAETLDDLCSALNIKPNVLFDFKYSDVNDTPLEEIVKRLKNNPTLLKTIYRIVLALDY